MSWEALKSAVTAVITANGNKEITGTILKDLLNNNIIPQLGREVIKGEATPVTNPGTPEKEEIYIAKTKGIYANFGGYEIKNEAVYFIVFNGTTWDFYNTGAIINNVFDLADGFNAASMRATWFKIRESTGTPSWDVLTEEVQTLEALYINTSGGISANNNFRCYDKFIIDTNNRYYHSGRSAANQVKYAFYDVHGIFISAQIEGGSAQTYNDTLIENIPVNTFYMAVQNSNSGTPVGHPYTLKIDKEVYNPITNTANIATLKTDVNSLEVDIVTENHDVRKTRLKIPVDVFSLLSDGSTISGQTITIPSGVTTNQLLGSIVPMRQDIPSDPPFLPLLALSGKVIRIGFVFKATGNLDNLQVLGVSMVNTGHNTITNRVNSINAATGYCVAYADWICGYTSGGANCYTTFTNDSVTDTVIELVSFFYSIVDENSLVEEKGISRYVIEEVVDNFKNTDLIELTKPLLPTEIPVAKGVELSIYYDNLRKIDDIDERQLRTYVRGYTGSNKPNRYQFLRDVTDSLGVLGLAVDTIGFNGKVMSSGGTLVRDVANNNGSGVLNTLIIGDSITQQAYWLLELLNLFKAAADNGGANINMFGTSSCNPAGFDEIMSNDLPFSLPLYSEGRSSWNTVDFLAAEKTSGLNQGANPFWNAARVGGADLDFSWYISELNNLSRYQSPNSISGIDLAIIVLGTNDMGLTLDQFILNIESIMDKLWRDYPNTNILIAGIPPKAFGSSVKAQIVEWNARLNDEFYTPRNSPTGTGVSGLAQINFWMDRINGYGRPLQSRVLGESALITGNSGARYDETHPFLAHLQMADAIFSAIQKIIL